MNPLIRCCHCYLPKSLKILFNSSTSDSPGKRGFINNNSPKIHPQDQTSIAVEYSLIPSNNSGARYHNVTTTAVYACNGDPYSRASPKSPTFKRRQIIRARFIESVVLLCIKFTANVLELWDYNSTLPLKFRCDLVTD